MCHRLSLSWVVIAVAVVVWNPAPAAAQGEALVRGQVVAAADGSPLPDSVVHLTPSSGGEPVGVAVDASGWFTFPNLRPGEYVLTASHQGFATREIRIALEPREASAVTLALPLQTVQESITVAGGGPVLASTHSPSSTLLTGERLATMPAALMGSLPDALVTSTPGMIRGHDDFVHVRGHEVAVNPVINGVSFWENPHALFSPGVSPLIVDTANVMTGAFPAEYGNRFGGVVDVVTKSGLGMANDASVSLGAGQAGRANIAGEFGGHRGRVGYYVFGSGFQSDRFLSPPDAVAIHDHGRGGHAFAQIDAGIGDAGLVNAVLMASGANFQIPRTPADVVLRPTALPEQRTRQQSAIVTWRHAWSDATIGASFYQRASSSRLDPASGRLTAQATFDRELLTVGGKADLTRLAGRHTVKLGADIVGLRPREDLLYRYDGYRELTHLIGLPHLHVRDNEIRFSGRETGGQTSAYLQDTIHLKGGLTADVGLRLDDYDLVVSATHVSPRVNLAFRLDSGVVLNASYNRFFVPPPIEGVLSSSAGLTARIQEIGVPLPAIAPSVDDQFEIGGSANAGPVRLALSGYYRTTDNPVHTTVWPDSRIYSYAGFDSERAAGLEAKVEASRLPRLGMTAFLNYALGRVHFYNPVTGGFVTEAGHFDASGRFLAPMDQTHTLTAGATYRHDRSGVWLGTTMEYGSGTPMGHGAGEHDHGDGADHAHTEASGAARVPGHFTANVSLGIDLLRRADRRPSLSFRIDVENVGDNLYLIARDSQFSPPQYSIPRLISATAHLRF